MKTLQGRSIACALALAGALAALPSAHGSELIANGGFEFGFVGWTVASQAGSDGTYFLQSGPTSPINNLPVAAPPVGLIAAMTDQQAGGSHVLYQDFVVPTGLIGGTLSFLLFVSSGDDFRTPATLDWATPALNQQARVDILLGSSDPFSVAPGDVLLSLFQTAPGSPQRRGYDSFSFDISSLLAAQQGQTLRLRFAEVDNVSFLNFGIDEVSITPAVLLSEPAVWLLAMAGVLIVVLRRYALAAAPSRGGAV